MIADGPPHGVYRPRRAAIEDAGVTAPIATQVASALGIDEVVLAAAGLDS